MKRPEARSRVDLNDTKRVRQDPTAKSISFFCLDLPARVDMQLIDQLEQVSRAAGEKNVRLCLHDSPTAQFHEMIILERGGKYYRPHKHRSKGESYHLIRGALGVFVFDDDGGIADACRLSEGDCRVYRIDAEMYHAVMPLTDPVIYHESKPGPFTGAGDSIFPEWAPTESDQEAIRALEQRMKQALASDLDSGEG